MSTYKNILLNFIIVFVILFSCAQKKENTHTDSMVNTDSTGFVTIIIPDYEFKYKHQSEKFYLRLPPQLVFYDGYVEKLVVLKEKRDYIISADTLRFLINTPKASVSLSLENEYTHNYLVYPNDTLFISFKDDLPTPYNARNYPSSNNQWLQPFSYKAFNPKYKSLMNARESYKETVGYYLKFYQEANQMVDTLHTRNHITEDAYIVAKMDVDAKMLNLKIHDKSPKSEDANWNLFKNFTYDELLLSSSYRDLIKNYVWSLNEKDPRKRFNLIKNDSFLQNKSKEFLLFNTLSQIADISFEDYEIWVAQFMEIVNHATVWKMIVDDIKPVKSIKSDDLIMYNTDMEKISFDEVKRKHRGKVIYVDFWASWCAPCIATMPKATQLRKKYSNDSVVFLYLAINDREKLWKENTEKYQLNQINAESYLIASPEAAFLQNLKLREIPRYILFDKDGQLVQSKAPSPKTDEIQKILDNLLRQQTHTK